MTRKIPDMAIVRFASVVGGRNNGEYVPLDDVKPILPTPGIKSTKLDITIKIKKVVANGKTQRVTRSSRMSPIKPSKLSTSASMAFCIPDGTSLMFFQVVARTMINMSPATIQVQTIEFVIGNPKT